MEFACSPSAALGFPDNGCIEPRHTDPEDPDLVPECFEVAQNKRLSYFNVETCVLPSCVNSLMRL